MKTKRPTRRELIDALKTAADIYEFYQLNAANSQQQEATKVDRIMVDNVLRRCGSPALSMAWCKRAGMLESAS